MDRNIQNMAFMDGEGEELKWKEVERDKFLLPRNLVVEATWPECFRLWDEFVQGERYTAVSFEFESGSDEVVIDGALRGICSGGILVVGKYKVRDSWSGPGVRSYRTVLVFRGEGGGKEVEEEDEERSVAFKEFCDKYVDKVVAKMKRKECRGGLPEALEEIKSGWGRYFGDTWLVKRAVLMQRSARA